MELRVKAKGTATYGGSGLMYRLAGYENAWVGEAISCNDSNCGEVRSIAPHNDSGNRAAKDIQG